MDRQSNLFQTHLSALTSLGGLAINSAILANGAAAVAVLALVGTVWGNDKAADIAPSAVAAIGFFASGVFAAISSAVFAYHCQYAFATADQHVTDPSWKRGLYLAARCLLAMAWVSCIAAVALFAFGAWDGVGALSRSGLGVAE